MTGKIIPFAQELRPLLPTVVGNVDYKTLRQQLDEIDALLRESGLQEQFIGLSVENWFKEATDREPTALEQQKFQERSRRALRCMVLRTLLQESFRVFTCNLAGNPLYQWFCCIDVIVRGKAGAEVEFGNTVLLGENKQGVILDYAMYRDQAPADSHLLFESMLRVLDGTGIQVGAVATDRGFASASNSRTLEEAGTYDATCPRNPKELGRRMKDKRFADMQRRRAQTEGRIGILKANFLGRPLRARGFESRELALAWGVLTHNLWALARLRKSKKQSQPSARAA
jgi:hypothetical protein